MVMVIVFLNDNFISEVKIGISVKLVVLVIVMFCK